MIKIILLLIAYKLYWIAPEFITNICIITTLIVFVVKGSEFIRFIGYIIYNQLKWLIKRNKNMTQFKQKRLPEKKVDTDMVRYPKKLFTWLDMMLAFLSGMIPVMLWHLWTVINEFLIYF